MKDPKDQKITGSKSHPVGTGVGAAGGAVTGATVGTAVGGPVGTVVGGAIGAAAGALAGQGVAEAINPAVEEAYWRENYSTRDYVEKGQPYSDYGPAYRYGWESRGRFTDQDFEEVEDDLGQGWDRVKGESRLGWDKAKQAVRDAFADVFARRFA